MYNLPHYKEQDAAAVLAFMKQYSFATLMGADAAGNPLATQIPFLFTGTDTELILQGHIQRKSDHHKAFEENPRVMALFTGPHTYVSASWYSNPQQASTWNYMTVQARGEIRFLDEDGLLEMLDKTTAFYENNPHSPSLYKELAPDYVQRMSKAIIAFEIKVVSIEHVFKLSQNRDLQSYDNIIRHLSAGDANAKSIADEMRKRKQFVFPV